jgi:hypothetical protein
MVVQPQLPFAERPPQRDLEIHARLRRGLHLRQEEAGTITPGDLGLRQRGLRRPDKVIGVIAVPGEQRDADADTELNLSAIHLERDRQHPTQVVGLMASAVRDDRHGITEFRQDHDETIAIQTAEIVKAADEVAEATGDQAQESVTGTASEGVVQQLEAIDIHQQQGTAVTGLQVPSDGELQSIRNQPAVRQGGQRVVIGVLHHRGLCEFTGSPGPQAVHQCVVVAPRDAQHQHQIQRGERRGREPRLGPGQRHPEHQGYQREREEESTDAEEGGKGVHDTRGEPREHDRQHGLGRDIAGRKKEDGGRGPEDGGQQHPRLRAMQAPSEPQPIE